MPNLVATAIPSAAGGHIGRGHQVVQSLGGITGAGRADVDDGGAHCLEEVAGPIEGFQGTADHDRQVPGSGLRHPAGDGRVEIVDAAAGGTFRQPTGAGRLTGSHVDDQAPRREPIQKGGRADQQTLHLSTAGQHQDDRVDPGEVPAQVVERPAAEVGCQLLCDARRCVVQQQCLAPGEIGGHRRTHVAQADEEHGHVVPPGARRWMINSRADRRYRAKTGKFSACGKWPSSGISWSCAPGRAVCSSCIAAGGTE